MRPTNPTGASEASRMPADFATRRPRQDSTRAGSSAAWRVMESRWLIALLSGALVGLLLGALALCEQEAVVSTRVLTPDPAAADCVTRLDCTPEARAFRGPADLRCCLELQ